MSKILRCWLWKKKQKGEEPKYQYDQDNTVSQINNEYNKDEEPKYQYDQDNTVSQIDNEYNMREVQNNITTHLRREYIALQPVYSENRKIKSHPASPERVPHEDKGYLSDQQLRQKTKGGEKISYRPTRVSAVVPQLKSKHKNPIEFPYQIPNKLAPQRSSLIYGVKYKESNPEMSETLRYAAKKSMEDQNLLSTSKIKIPSKSDKYDMLLNTDSDSKTSDSIGHEETKQKTVIRLRPGSVRRAKPASELVKLMKFHANTENNRPTTLGKYVHQLPLRANKQATILKTSDGRLLQPVERNKVRSSLTSQREYQAIRESIADSLDENTFQRTGDNALSTMITKNLSLRNSVSRPSRTRRYSEDNFEEQEYPEPFSQSSNKPVVYAVPAPTRGRAGSILQHSVKTLVSKADQPPIHRKNIRYSVDTDVFSADTRRTSVKQSSPRYVNMEKGQPSLLVSDFLNPITSIFVTDLKDPIPKDPLTKPKESNVWVKTKRNCEEKSPKQSVKSSPRVVSNQNRSAKPKVVPIQKRPSRPHSSRNDSLSSSDEESDSWQINKRKQYAQRKHYVYTSDVPDYTLPDPSMKTIRNPQVKKLRQHIETEPKIQNNFKGDICGFNCNASEVLDYLEEQTQYDMMNNDKFVSRAQQTDDEEIDLFCYPSKKFITASAGSKLRWRIIIKRGD